MVNNYEQLLERISKSSEVEKEELERRIEAKRAKLSGLVSKEGAAQIVAAELGISFDNEKMKISELIQGMKRANVSGKITRVFPIREFSKNGREGKIGSFLLGDDTANIRVVLWDVKHIDLIEKGELEEGSVIEIMNGSVRNGELHLSGFSDLKKSKEKFDKVKTERTFNEGNLKDAKAGLGMKIRAVIVQAFEPRHFESKTKEGQKGVLLNIILDDGSETIRAVLFGENIKKLGLSDEEISSFEKFNEKKEELLGEEKIFTGSFRMNNFFNVVEMNIDNVEEIDSQELIKKLESKSYSERHE